MQLFQVWKESLSLYKASNLKLFLLISLKSIWGVYKTSSWYLGGLALAMLLTYEQVSGYLDSMPTWLLVVKVLFTLLFVFSLFLALRPSVTQKNPIYFLRHLLFIVPFVVWVAIVYETTVMLLNSTSLTFKLFSILGAFITGAIGWLIPEGPITFQSTDSGWLNMFWDLFIPVIHIWLVPLGLFFTLFMLDTDGRPYAIIKSFQRALKMIYYNYPAVLLLYVLSVVVYGIILLPVPLIPLAQLWSLVLLPIPVSFFANFYIKYVHSQFGLYFSEKHKA